MNIRWLCSEESIFAIFQNSYQKKKKKKKNWPQIYCHLHLCSKQKLDCVNSTTVLHTILWQIIITAEYVKNMENVPHPRILIIWDYSQKKSKKMKENTKISKSRGTQTAIDYLTDNQRNSEWQQNTTDDSHISHR